MRKGLAIAGLLAASAAMTLPSAVTLAKSGHFIKSGRNAPVCTDIGTQVSCNGKVAGLAGDTFEITVEADGIAVVECENPGGNVAPGQNTEVSVEGGTGELETPRNGNYNFTDLRTADPDPLPAVPTCPNPQWTPHIIDVIFTTATLTLIDGGEVVDVVTVAVQ